MKKKLNVADTSAKLPYSRKLTGKQLPAFFSSLKPVVSKYYFKAKILVKKIPAKKIPVNTDIIQNFGRSAFFVFLKIVKSPFFRSKKFTFVIIPVIVLLGLLFSGYYWYSYSYGANYSATLKYTYKEINQSKAVELSSVQGSSAKITKLTAEDSASISINTTDEKATGEKAKGAVTIFNSTSDAKVIPVGTVLTCLSNSCPGLTYSIDRDMNLGPGLSEEVAVTAGDIGENYNLVAGAGRFQVGKFDSKTEVLASNVKPIEGGTPKKMVKVVSKKDIKNAEDSALRSLQESLTQKVKDDPANERYVLAQSDTAAKIEKISTTPDKNEGEEAEVANVTVKAKITIDAIEKGALDTLIEDLKKELTPSGYSLDTKQTKVTTGFTTKSKDAVQVSITVQSVARPNIDIDKLKNDLSGKPYSSAKQILAGIPNVKEYSDNFEPKTLPQYFWTIPKNTHKVEIKLLGEKG